MLLLLLARLAGYGYRRRLGARLPASQAIRGFAFAHLSRFVAFLPPQL